MVTQSLLTERSVSLSNTRHIVVAGVSGCGKSTVGQALADQFGLPYQDADDLHPKSNVEKMRSGQPLNDEDRWPWLDVCAQALSSAPQGLILGCSALRRVYRDRLREVAGMPNLTFVHLSGTPELLLKRISERKDHYMPPSLLMTQLETLEPLDADETSLKIDIDQSVEDMIQEIMRGLNR